MNAFDPRRERKPKKYLYFGLSVCTSVLLAGYLLSHIEPALILKTFSSLHLTSLFIYFFLASLGILARTYRYQLLVASDKLGFYPLMLVTVVRNLFVDLLPAKIGSLSYVYLTNRRLGVPLETAASSFLLAFVFDLVVLFPIFFLAILFTRIDSAIFPLPIFLTLSAILFAVVASILIWLSTLLKVAGNLLAMLLKRYKSNFPRAGVALDKLFLTAKDIERIQAQKGRYLKVVASSFLVRAFKYGSLYFLLHAVVANLNFSIEDLNFWKVFLGILGAELSALFPIQGLAGIGTWESAWALTFRFLGHFDTQIAIVSGFGVHLVTQMFEYSLGILGMLILYLPAWKSARLSNEKG